MNIFSQKCGLVLQKISPQRPIGMAGNHAGRGFSVVLAGRGFVRGSGDMFLQILRNMILFM